MTASSATVMSNLAFLVGAVVLAALGGVVVWLRHRQPKSVDATMESFRRGLDVIAPDSRSASPSSRGGQSGIRAEAGGLAAVRTIRSSGQAAAGGEPDPAAPVTTVNDSGFYPAESQMGDQAG